MVFRLGWGYFYYMSCPKAHWGRVTHICVNELNSIGSDNGLSPDRCKAVVWADAGILLIGPLGTNRIEIFLEIYTFSSKKIHLKMPSGKWRPFCASLNHTWTLGDQSPVKRPCNRLVMLPGWQQNIACSGVLLLTPQKSNDSTRTGTRGESIIFHLIVFSQTYSWGCHYFLIQVDNEWYENENEIE